MRDTPWILRIGAIALTLFLIVVMIYPLFWIMFGSMKTTAELVADPYGLPNRLNFENIAELWFDGDFPLFFRNSLIISVVAVIGIVLMSAMAGYVFARRRLPYVNLLMGVFLLGMFIPQQITLVPVFSIIGDLGLRNTLLGVILVQWSWIPFGIFLLRAYFLTIPEELVDAARIDGCSEFQIFRLIFFPLAKPALVTIAIIYFLWSWNDFIWPLVLIQKTDLYTIQLGIFRFKQQFTVNYGLQLAGLVVAVYPPLIFYLIFRKGIQSGLTSGAVKL